MGYGTPIILWGGIVAAPVAMAVTLTWRQVRDFNATIDHLFAMPIMLTSLERPQRALHSTQAAKWVNRVQVSVLTCH